MSQRPYSVCLRGFTGRAAEDILAPLWGTRALPSAGDTGAGMLGQRRFLAWASRGLGGGTTGRA